MNPRPHKLIASHCLLHIGRVNCKTTGIYLSIMASENIETQVDKTKCFIWTALPLRVVADYKIKKLQDAQDWETARVKYEDICKRFIAAYHVKSTLKSSQAPLVNFKKIE